MKFYWLETENGQQEKERLFLLYPLDFASQHYYLFMKQLFLSNWKVKWNSESKVFVWSLQVIE